MTLVSSPVRKAIPADLPELMEMCRALHSENAMFAMDEDKVSDMLKRAFDGRGAIIGVLGEKGNIQGNIYLSIAQFWYTQEWSLEELYSFVLPEHRKSDNAKELISFAKRCSLELGIPLVIGVVSNIRTRAKVGLYTRQLSEPVGAYFAFNMPKRDNAQKTA